MIITPQSLDVLPHDFQLSIAERGFHNLLHIGGADSLFLTFIKNLKSAGSRYFIPHAPDGEYDFEEQIGMLFLRNQIGLISRAARLPGGILGEQDTRQSELISSLRSLLSFAEDLQRIHNKTYCIAGINLVFSTEIDREERKELFITLP